MVTGTAALLVLAILLTPARVDDLTPAALLRIPVEGLIGAAAVLAAPGRVRPYVAALVGVTLGLWAVVRIVDIGFYAALDRPFDPVQDWGFLEAGGDVLGRSMGSVGAGTAVIVAVLAAVLVLALVTLSVLRLSRIAGRRRARSGLVIGVLAAVWVLCAATGMRLAESGPVAAHDYVERLAQVRTSLSDRAAFESQLTDDPYRDSSGDELLTALRGKDVMLVVVESYGRAALEHPEIAPRVTDVLADGDRRLAAAGFAARSAFLTSPTVGGGSWLADATLLSGAWISNQDRYGAVARSDRMPLTAAFHRAGWRTVALMPGVTSDWPEGPFYSFDQIRSVSELGYAGPNYSFDTMPDQYVLSQFQHTERAPEQRGPVMAVIPLISSHAPWTPVPALRDWDDVGDGSTYAPPAEALTSADSIWQGDAAAVRANYANANVYSLSTLVSYVETYGDDDLVLIFLGDHQPAPVVTGEGATRDVPVSIVARDPAVLDRLAQQGWRDGLAPDPQAPVWRMDGFRDRFLTAFR